jgi:hypothetical protein
MAQVLAVYLYGLKSSLCFSWRDADGSQNLLYICFCLFSLVFCMMMSWEFWPSEAGMLSSERKLFRIPHVLQDTLFRRDLFLGDVYEAAGYTFFGKPLKCQPSTGGLESSCKMPPTSAAIIIAATAAAHVINTTTSPTTSRTPPSPSKQIFRSGTTARPIRTGEQFDGLSQQPSELSSCSSIHGPSRVTIPTSPDRSPCFGIRANTLRKHRSKQGSRNFPKAGTGTQKARQKPRPQTKPKPKHPPRRNNKLAET